MPTHDELQRALSHLGPFGYIANPREPDPVVERFGFALASVPVRGPLSDEDIIKALKIYQQRNRLKVTGELDQPTLELMNTPRCGVPDIFEYAVWGIKWGHTDLTYAIAESSTDMTMAETRAGLEEAFGLWAAVTPLTFREVGVGDSPDIVIRFVHGDHGDGNPFDGPWGVLAHAFMPRHGACHFDEAETWVLSGAGVHFPTVSGHEIGHLLGLLHSENPDALMAPYYRGPAPWLHLDDRNGIQALYGPKPAPEPPPPVPEPVPPPAPTPEPFPPAADPPAARVAWVP